MPLAHQLQKHLMAPCAVCLLGLVRLVACVEEDRVALVQQGLHLHDQVDLKTQEERRELLELQDLLDSPSAQNTFADQAAHLEKVKAVAMSHREKEFDIAPAAEQEASPPANLNLVGERFVSEMTEEDLPAELQNMLAEARNGGLADAKIYESALPMLHQRLHGEKLASKEELEEVSQKAEMYLEAWKRGGPFVEKMLSLVPKLYQMLQDPSLLAHLPEAAEMLDASNPSTLMDVLRKSDASQAARLLQTSGKVHMAERGNATRVKCQKNPNGVYLVASISGGVKWFPDSNFGPMLQIDVGTSYSNKGFKDPLECMSSHPFIGIGLSNKTQNGDITGIHALARFDAKPGLPFDKVTGRSLALNYGKRLAVDETEIGAQKKTVLFDANFGSGWRDREFFSDSVLTLHYKPVDIMDNPSGWYLGMTPRVGFNYPPDYNSISLGTQSNFIPWEGGLVKKPNIGISNDVGEGDKFFGSDRFFGLGALFDR